MTRHLIRPAFDNGDVAGAHRGRDQLAVEVDLILDVVIGGAREFVLGHARKTDLRG